MKEYFKTVFRTKLFNAFLGLLLFLILAFSFDYMTDEVFTFESILFDFGYSLIFCILLIFLPESKNIKKENLKKRAELLEIFGKMFIGFLLFLVLFTLIILH